MEVKIWKCHYILLYLRPKNVNIMQLPEAFIDDMRPYLPADELASLMQSISHTAPSTAVRINPRKGKMPEGVVRVPWSKDGYYLSERPEFTLDPLLHAGCYYVQEAGSQFVTHVISEVTKDSEGTRLHILDLCAAPGGKSTAILGTLGDRCTLISNEIDRRRARILAENITKWGYDNVTVTANAPRDFRQMRNAFDIILVDAPCSGEGMFRKDPDAVKDWSPAKVQGCVETQREILIDIWGCLKPGGVMIYSTCTYNVHEDEEQVAYICNELGATPIQIPVEPEWNIRRELIGSAPCYRFMPHKTQGEGLFMAAMRKASDTNTPTPSDDGKRRNSSMSFRGLYVLQSGIAEGEKKGKDLIPSHAEAMWTSLPYNKYPRAEVDLETALQYLRRESITLDPDMPRGYVLVCYEGHPLGFAKNIGNRANNLYPQEWRIRYK